MPASKKTARTKIKQPRAPENRAASQAKPQAPARGPAPAGPIPAAPVSQAHKQAMAIDAGRVVGNRGLARMIGAVPAGPAPAVQRIGLLGPMALTSVLATREGVERAVAEIEPLKKIEEELARLTPLVKKLGQQKEEGVAESEEDQDEGSFKGHKLEYQVNREELVAGIRALRERIPVEVAAGPLGISPELANAIRRRFYLHLARITPFYAQWDNKNILSSGGKPARERTCNVSTVAITLEGLGKTTSDFQGNDELMDNITSILSLGTTDATSLRLPDFLQILAIYIRMKRANKISFLNALAVSNPPAFQELMVAAAEHAAGDILSSDLFKNFTGQFGVSSESYNLDISKYLAIFGAYYKPQKKEFKKFLAEKGQAKAGGEKREALWNQFIGKRKAEQRMRAARAGKQITSSEGDLRESDQEIATARAALAAREKELEGLGKDVERLEADVSGLTGQVEAAEDGPAKQALQKDLAAARAALKAKSKEKGRTEKKKEQAQASLETAERERRETMHKLAELRMEQTAREAVGSETQEEELVEDALPIEVYQAAVIPLMTDLLASGAQIIVVLENHFVKLQEINENAIIVHDPGGTTRASKPISWETARQLGYFKRYNIVQ